MCAVCWAVYITRMEKFAHTLPTKALTAAHLWVVMILGAIWTWQAHEAVHAIPWAAVIYLGVAATAATTWFQTVGQRYVSAPQAAVLYTMEPLWAALFGWIVLRERFGMQGWMGAALIIMAAMLTQLPSGWRSPEIRHGPT